MLLKSKDSTIALYNERAKPKNFLEESKTMEEKKCNKMTDF